MDFGKCKVIDHQVEVVGAKKKRHRTVLRVSKDVADEALKGQGLVSIYKDTKQRVKKEDVEHILLQVSGYQPKLLKAGGMDTLSEDETADLLSQLLSAMVGGTLVTDPLGQELLKDAADAYRRDVPFEECLVSNDKRYNWLTQMNNQTVFRECVKIIASTEYLKRRLLPLSVCEVVEGMINQMPTTLFFSSKIDDSMRSRLKLIDQHADLRNFVVKDERINPKHLLRVLAGTTDYCVRNKKRFCEEIYKQCGVVDAYVDPHDIEVEVKGRKTLDCILKRLGID